MLRTILTNLLIEHNIDSDIKADVNGISLDLYDYETGLPLGGFFADDDEQLVLNLVSSLANFKREQTVGDK